MVDFVARLYLIEEKLLVVPVKGRRSTGGPSSGSQSSPFQGRLLQQTERGWL